MDKKRISFLAIGGIGIGAFFNLIDYETFIKLFTFVKDSLF